MFVIAIPCSKQRVVQGWSGMSCIKLSVMVFEFKINKTIKIESRFIIRQISLNVIIRIAITV